MIRKLLLFPLILLALLGSGWAIAALVLDGPQSTLVFSISSSHAAALLFCSMSLLNLWYSRTWTRRCFQQLLLVAVVVAWWSSIAPSNNRNWTPDVARLAHASIEGNLLTVTNVRNFDYRSETDFSERWESRTYDLSQVTGMDLFLSYWGSPWIAHTVGSWQFADGQHLAFSIETRKEIGEQYSAVLGFFKTYELYFVAADERDVIRLRTNYRNEDVYRYSMKNTPEEARALLVKYVEQLNELHSAPRWYNAFTHNCTTEIRRLRGAVGQARKWDWRMLVNGRLDELGYENGAIDNSLPFPEIRRRARITDRAKGAGDAADFSRAIRE